jgi:hypothetical protein
MYSGEAGSHEIGHNLNLSHDGKGATAYYGGHVIATGSPYTWNAIMGGGVIPDISQWSKGEYYQANNTEDDLDILKDSLPYRTDAVGDTNGTASPIAHTGATIDQTGLIERNTDIDVYSLLCDPGAIALNATTLRQDAADWGANLDMKLELYNGVGALVASNDPTSEIHPAISYTVPATGTYYLHVKPAAQGTPTNSTPTGYTVYGCLGGYTLAGTFVPWAGHRVRFQTDGLAGATLTGGVTELTQTVGSGSSCTPVEAFAPAHYAFKNWTKGGAVYSVTNPLTVTIVTADMTFTANFAVKTFTVRLDRKSVV